MVYLLSFLFDGMQNIASGSITLFFLVINVNT